jgi:dolichol-phosphate mannosyltransferase
MKLSIVVPVYGSPESVPELSQRLINVLPALTEEFEVILVNDGCPKGSWAEVVDSANRFDQVVGINLSRNFGQHMAITAGLEVSKGDRVVVMDCDLQDVPEQIPVLWDEINKGFDSVVAQRIERNDKFLKRMSSKAFHAFLTYMTDTKSDASIANFGIYSRQVIDSYLKLKEQIRFFPLHVRWLGYDTSAIEVSHAERFEGVSSYTLSKLLRLALDIIISFSDKPLRLMVKLGFLMSLFATLATVYLLIKYFLYSTSVEGWTSLMVSIWFLGGFIISMLGVVGIYVAKTFDETKARHLYLVKERFDGNGALK